jgi:[ribosomal protein S5]-alanine N-acetyltransferase
MPLSGPRGTERGPVVQNDQELHLSSSDLTTDRLVLRPWTSSEVTAVTGGTRRPHWADDFPSEGDRVIAGFIAGNPSALGEFGQRQIIERSTGQVVGAIGLFWPPADGEVEFGYGVVASRRGRGYATEAAREVLRHGFETLGLPQIVSFTAVANEPSRAVMRRLGMRHDVDGDFDHPVLTPGHPLQRHVLYRLTAEEWRSSRSRGVQRD